MPRVTKVTAWWVFAFVLGLASYSAYCWHLFSGLGEMSDGGGGGYQPTLARAVWHWVPFVSLALFAWAFCPLLPVVFQTVLLLLSFVVFEALALEIVPSFHLVLVPSAVAAMITLFSWFVLTDLKDKKPNQSTDPTTASGTPVAGQPPRQP